MISIKEAKGLASNYIDELNKLQDDRGKLCITGEPRECYEGWLFNFNNEHYVKTGDPDYAIIGRGLCFGVSKSNGSILRSGDGSEIGSYIHEAATRPFF